MFPSHREIKPSVQNLLRTSGDVSISSKVVIYSNRFAPHERRCFSVQPGCDRRTGICSARAEMFLVGCISAVRKRHLLRTSGDVSTLDAIATTVLEFAPHERRCFLHNQQDQHQQGICSARAEMFPDVLCIAVLVQDLLRTSGDVSSVDHQRQKRKLFAPHERRCF